MYIHVHYVGWMSVNFAIVIIQYLPLTFKALITDLFMDVASFKSQSVKSKVPELLALLDNCELDSLAEFFRANLSVSWSKTPPPREEGSEQQLEPGGVADSDD